MSFRYNRKADGGEVEPDPFEEAARRTVWSTRPPTGRPEGLATKVPEAIGEAAGRDVQRMASWPPRMVHSVMRMNNPVQSTDEPTPGDIAAEGIGTLGLGMFGPGRPLGSIGSGGLGKKPYDYGAFKKQYGLETQAEKVAIDDGAGGVIHVNPGFKGLSDPNLTENVMPLLKQQMIDNEILTKAFGKHADYAIDSIADKPMSKAVEAIKIYKPEVQSAILNQMKAKYPEAYPKLMEKFGSPPVTLAKGPGEFASNKVDLNDYVKPINDTAKKFMEQWKSWSLPPKPESQRLRHKGELGFSTKAYRGTGDRPELPYFRGVESGENAVFSTPNPRLANMYANALENITDLHIREGAQIMPLVLNTEKYIKYDAKGTSWGHANAMATRKAREANAPGVIIENVNDTPFSGPKGDYSTGEGTNTVYLTLGNGLNTIRSPFARFDPQAAHEAHLLKGIGGMGVVGTGGAMLIQPNEKQEFAMGGAVDRTARKYAKGGMAGHDVSDWAQRRAIHKSVGPGMLKSTVPGRTDKLPIGVPSGSYVIPADIVSGIGQGNSDAGNEILSKMFTAGPMGMSPKKTGKPGQKGRLRTGKVPKAGKISALADGGMAMPEMAEPEAPPEEVPVIAAGGEVILTPDQVMAAGNGDLKHGHEVLDAFVKMARKNIIKEMKGLPGPSK